MYLAQQRDLDRFVALKALFGSSTSGAAEALMDESRLAGSLSHPNIVTVYEYLEEGPTSCIAMEFVPRGSLRVWVGHLSLAQIVGVIEGLLAGLAAVRPVGIVHRDLKPENVMVTADGRIKITDFGIAKASARIGERDLAARSSGVIVGTPAYMAPEQALGGSVGSWTDLYSVGVIAYEQLLGRIPFHETRSSSAMLLQHIKEPIPAPASVDPSISGALSEWVAHLLVKDPSKRGSDPRTAWEQLEEIVIDLLGPRWRRDAQLMEPGAERSAAPQTLGGEFVSQRISVQALSAEARSNVTRVSGPENGGISSGVQAPAIRQRRRALGTRLAIGACVALATMAGFMAARGHAFDGGTRTGERTILIGRHRGQASSRLAPVPQPGGIDRLPPDQAALVCVPGPGRLARLGCVVGA